MSVSEYKHYIDNHKKYTDFNTLGLYRSIGENEKLNISDKIEIRDYANETFGKTFNFYQLKAPGMYFELITLGDELTEGDENQIWEEIRKNQQEILKKKRIKHRNLVYFFLNCVLQSTTSFSTALVAIKKDDENYTRNFRSKEGFTRGIL